MDDIIVMRRCLDLAGKGNGSVSPNPMVGCVIVKDGEIIGEGYHQELGGPHAEVNAIRSAARSLEGAEVYVNLEPCSYFGKTPPCVDLLIEKRVRKVHAAMLDPNPRVNGEGVRRLRAAGIEVDVGLLEIKARKLNEKFVKFMIEKTPFVTLKIAQSIDGKIALSAASPSTKTPIEKYITSQDSLGKVHLLRSEYDAILVGAGTVRQDDPELTVRFVKGKSPVRVILDGKVSTSAKSRVFCTQAARTILIYDALMEKTSSSIRRKLSVLKKSGVGLLPLTAPGRKRISLSSVLTSLASQNFSSLLVEGGADIFSQFIGAGLADKIHIFTAPRILGRGKAFADGLKLKSLSDAIVLKDLEVAEVGEDLMFTGYLRK